MRPDAPSGNNAAPDKPAPLVRLRGIRKSFSGVTALGGVDFDLLPGEVHGLAGENGAGKSTFIKIISGAYTPDAGEIEVGGERTYGLSTVEARQAGIAVVYQEFNLLPDLTVAENIFIGQLPRGLLGAYAPRQTRVAARDVLERLGSNLDCERLAGELSVAEQQIVEIGKALAQDARIVIMDEPSTVLARDELDALHRVVRRLRADGRGVIYISHRLDEMLALSDRITVFKDGERVRTARVSEWDHARLIHAMIGRELVNFFPHRTAPQAVNLLQVSGVTVPDKIFDVFLTLSRGEIVGIAGLGGSGKTTLCRALVGLETWSEGTGLLEGAPIPRTPGSAARAGLVMVPEDRKGHGIFPGHSVGFNVSIAVLEMFRSAGLIGRGRERDFVAGALDRFDVRPRDAKRDIAKLSGGNQQKAVLARWFSRDPKVVILDEPTRGVDVGAKAEIYAIVGRIAEAGKGVLVASSDVTELLGICDRILVFHEGRLVEDLPRAAATEEAVIRAATIPPSERLSGVAA